MNVNTLISDIVETVAEDTAVKNWSEHYYGRIHQVFENIDLRNPPGSGECPYVFAAPDYKSCGQTQRQRAHRVRIGCCIYDETKEAHDTIPNLTQFRGAQRIEELRKLVETAVVAIDVGNGVWGEIEIEFDTISQFPFHKCEMVVTMTEPVTLGSDFLA